MTVTEEEKEEGEEEDSHTLAGFMSVCECVRETLTCQGAVNLSLSVSVLDVEGDVHLLLFVIRKLHTHIHVVFASCQRTLVYICSLKT